MKALLFAYSEIGVTALETLLELGLEVVGVVTHTDNPWKSVGFVPWKNWRGPSRSR